MSDQQKEWFKVKLEMPKGSLNCPIAAEGKMQRVYGPRADFAVVSLYLESSSEFLYIDEAEWSADEEHCSPAVMEGVIDALTGSF